MTRWFAMLPVASGMMFCFLLIYQSVWAPFQVVRSGSMAPHIETDDAVVIRKVEPEEVEVGQVIIFRDPVEKNRTDHGTLPSSRLGAPG